MTLREDAHAIMSAALTVLEAAHPVPDENSFSATQAAIDAVAGLGEEDNVLFLLSGGGSALFEKPLIPIEDLDRLTHDLLACGADIVEMNTVRKRFSAVKGGRFAQLCAPAKVFSVVLSDIIGDPLDMIASGPTDAAGGYVDGGTASVLAERGVDIFKAMENNDSYHALEQCGGLIKTGPTGTNVNDFSVVLIKRG